MSMIEMPLTWSDTPTHQARGELRANRLSLLRASTAATPVSPRPPREPSRHPAIGGKTFLRSAPGGACSPARPEAGTDSCRFALSPADVTVSPGCGMVQIAVAVVWHGHRARLSVRLAWSRRWTRYRASGYPFNRSNHKILVQSTVMTTASRGPCSSAPLKWRSLTELWGAAGWRFLAG
jgi:hypothetical protein